MRSALTPHSALRAVAWSMRTWSARLSGLFATWRVTRYRVNAAKAELRDERQAEELEQAREGVRFRFPLGGGGLG